MDQLLSQLPLSARIPTLAKAVIDCRSRMTQLREEEAVYTDLLAQAEAAVAGKAPGYEGVELSGLISQNPYIPGTPPASDEQGDPQNPKAAGDHPHAGSESSPRSHSKPGKKSPGAT